MTVQDLITATLKLIGSIAKNEVPDADESADAFARLNDMIDSWATDRLMVYGVVRSVFNLTSAKQTYTIGTGGDFNVARPLWIQDAGIISTSYNPNFELPIAILSDDDWSEVTLKSTQAALSWYLYYDYAYPLGNINFWPVPNVTTLQVALYLPTAITEFAALSTVVALPPGYAEAIRYNLAVRLCPEFGRPLDPVVAQMAAQTKHNIELANIRLEALGVDPTLTGGGGRTAWNWVLGTGGAYR